MTDGYSITTIAGREYSVGPSTPPPPTISIRANDNRYLLTIRPDGTVEGEIEDASEAARLFVESLRGYFPQTMAQALAALENPTPELLDVVVEAFEAGKVKPVHARIAAALTAAAVHLKKQSK
jgi:hypothetical protein